MQNSDYNSVEGHAGAPDNIQMAVSSRVKAAPDRLLLPCIFSLSFTQKNMLICFVFALNVPDSIQGLPHKKNPCEDPPQ